MTATNCTGPRRILGAVTEPHTVQHLLAALGLAAKPTPPGSVTARQLPVDPSPWAMATATDRCPPEGSHEQ